MEKTEPMAPIVLTQSGDTMSEHRSIDPNHHTKEDDKLVVTEIIGVHDVCNAVIFLLLSSETHNALLCQICHLRIPVPVHVGTYGELRQWCDKRLNGQEETEDF